MARPKTPKIKWTYPYYPFKAGKTGLTTKKKKYQAKALDNVFGKDKNGYLLFNNKKQLVDTAPTRKKAVTAARTYSKLHGGIGVRITKTVGLVKGKTRGSKR